MCFCERLIKDCTCTYLDSYKNNNMQITVPKIRVKEKWVQNESKIKTLLKQKNEREVTWFTFKQYCQYSLYFIEAPNEIFTSLDYREQLEKLANPKLNFNSRGDNFKDDEKRRDQNRKEQQAGNRIKDVLAYAWKNIISLIQGKSSSSQGQGASLLGIYTDENIDLNFARLEEMLIELKGKRYRCGVYIKENAYTRELSEKQMDQELVFIKLLQNILRTQTNKIIQARVTHREPANDQQQPREPEKKEVKEVVIEEKLADIREVVKVKEYFERKLANMKMSSETTKDPIDRRQENRRFNSAVIRYHLQNAQSRR